MGRVFDFFTGSGAAFVETTNQQFAEVLTSPEFGLSIDPGTLYGFGSLDEAMRLSRYGKLSRSEAISVPAVKRARDLIAGGIGQQPLILRREADQKDEFFELLSAPEEGKAASTTWTNVVDDLIFHGHAWLRVVNLGWHGRPATVVRLDPASVTVQPNLKVYVSRSGNGTSHEWVPDSQLIRIDSPNDPLLVAGARAIRVLGRLEDAALNSADGVPPQDYFTAKDGAKFPADDVKNFLTSWMQARKERRTAFVPSEVDYHSNQISPKDLQLIEAREFAITEIARLTGIDANDLSVSVTTETYQNMQDRRLERLDFVLGPYMTAITSRLSMPDICPPGYKVVFESSEFRKTDDKTQAETDAILLNNGIVTVNEVRARRGLSPLPEPAPVKEPSHV